MRFEVGDRVRIRDWNDMATDFSVDYDGDISFEDDPVSPYFTGDMQYLCGETGEVYDIHYNAYGDGIDEVFIKLDDDDVLIAEWEISNLMIEPEGCEIISDDVDKLCDFLSNK
jgi:hypothetical protein